MITNFTDNRRNIPHRKNVLATRNIMPRSSDCEPHLTSRAQQIKPPATVHNLLLCCSRRFEFNVQTASSLMLTKLSLRCSESSKTLLAAVWQHETHFDRRGTPRTIVAWPH